MNAQEDVACGGETDTPIKCNGAADSELLVAALGMVKGNATLTASARDKQQFPLYVFMPGCYLRTNTAIDRVFLEHEMHPRLL